MRALPLCRNENENDDSVMAKDHLAMVLNNLGMVERELNKIEEAERHFAESAKIYKQISDEVPVLHRVDLGMVLLNLGHVQNRLGHLDLAEKSLRSALAIHEAEFKLQPTRYIFELSNSRESLGNLLAATNRFDEAEPLLIAALEHRKQAVDSQTDQSQFHLARTLSNFSSALSNAERDEEALTHVSEAIEILKILYRKNEVTYGQLLGNCLTNQAVFAHDLGKLPLAKKSYEEAIVIWERIAVLTPTVGLAQRQIAYEGLGIIIGQQKVGFLKARELFRQGVKCSNEWRATVHDPQHRQRLHRAAIGNYERLFEISLKISRAGLDHDADIEAVETAEASRARLLGELLADETLIPKKCA